MALGAVLLGLLAFLVFTGRVNLDFLKRAVQVIQPTNELPGKDAYALALDKARLWQEDAVLVYLSSGQISRNNGAESWSLIFVSPELKQKGYEVLISNKQIFSEKEIDYVYSGEIVPLEFKVTPEQAVARVRNMPAYSGAEILSLDAVYGIGTQTWYWGIKTSQGTISLEAR